MERPTAPIRRLTPDGARTAAHVFSTYGGRLYAYFRFMLGNDDAARGALTDTVVGAAGDSAAGGGGRPSDPGQPAARIFTLARVEYRRYAHAGAVGDDATWTAGTPHGGRMGLPEIARLAVSRLSPEVREAFVLSAPHNGLSLPDLAKVMGVSLENAADLRAQAGLDFVRALALCADEAGYTMYSGAEMRRRAEASLARDGEEAPSLPALDAVALAPFREQGEEPPAPRDALPMRVPAPLPPVPPPAPATLVDLVPVPAAPVDLPAADDRVDLPAADDRASHWTGRLDGDPDYRPADYGPADYRPVGPADYGLEDYGPRDYGQDEYDTADPEQDGYGPPDYGPAGHAFGRRMTGPLGAITGPLQAAGGHLAGERGSGRRKKVVLAGVSGAAAVTLAVVAAQFLMPGGSAFSLNPGGSSNGVILPSMGAVRPADSSPAASSASATPTPSARHAAASQTQPAPVGGYSTGSGTVPMSSAPSAQPSPQPSAPKPKPSPRPSSTTPTPSGTPTTTSTGTPTPTDSGTLSP